MTTTPVHHILPINDLRPHREGVDCPCGPTVIRERYGVLVIHNAWDAREAFEDENLLTEDEK